MRLIDANVLLKVFKALISAYRQIEGKHNWGDHCRIPAFEFMDALKSAKTIEAIPISFLYEYMALCESVGAYQSKETIECLIDDWREETGEKDEC